MNMNMGFHHRCSRRPEHSQSMGIRTPGRMTKQWLRGLFSPASCGSRSSSEKPNQQCEPIFDKLPEDIKHRIHSLLPVRDAARAACVSRWFLHSWRCYSNLALSAKTLGLTDRKSGAFIINIVDHILKKHSGIGVEILTLNLLSCENIDASYLDRWFQIAVCSGIKQITLLLSTRMNKEYIFPCPVLLDEAVASSLQILGLYNCTFRPTAALGCLRKLRRLYLTCVHITEEELGHFLSKSLALEKMIIIDCSEIYCLRIPCMLQKLKYLSVSYKRMKAEEIGAPNRMQALEISAPNLSTLLCSGNQVKISVSDPSQLKDVGLICFTPDNSTFTLSYACARLPDFSRNVKSLSLFCFDESVNTPMLISTFPSLKKLEITLSFFRRSLPSFDVSSLVPFLDASLALDSFILNVGEDHADSVAGGVNANYLRWEPQYRHGHLRHVTITGFCSAKNLIQLVIYILESAPSLECLTLDANSLYPRERGTSGKKKISCWMNGSNVVEANRAFEDAVRHIAERVPPGVRFQVLNPC